MGKSRLAAEIGRLALNEFDAGVSLVELAPVSDPSAVATTLATAFSIRPQAGASTKDAILDWLHGQRLLLIIDNHAARVAQPPERSFPLTSWPRSRAARRHQTLRATVAWSYDLVTDHERALFAVVCVFAGGFDHSAAQDICSGEEFDEADVLPLLVSLVDKSMVIAERQVQGMRYRLLETLRQFGEERLVDNDATTQWRNRHLRFYAVAAERNESAYRSLGQRKANAWFDREWDNIRFAWAWALATGDCDRAFALVVSTFDFAVHWLRVEHADWLTAALATTGSDRAVTAKVNALLATWMSFIGTAEHAIASLAKDSSTIKALIPRPQHRAGTACLPASSMPVVAAKHGRPLPTPSLPRGECRSSTVLRLPSPPGAR